MKGDRIRNLQVADAVMLPNFQHRPESNVIQSLSDLIVVHQNQLPPCSTREQIRDRQGEALQHVVGLAVQVTRPRRTHLDVPQCIPEKGVTNRRTDGVGVGVLVPDDENGFLHRWTFENKAAVESAMMPYPSDPRQPNCWRFRSLSCQDQGEEVGQRLAYAALTVIWHSPLLGFSIYFLLPR